MDDLGEMAEPSPDYLNGWKDCCVAFGITQEMQDAYELRTVGRRPEDDEALPVWPEAPR